MSEDKQPSKKPVKRQAPGAASAAADAIDGAMPDGAVTRDPHTNDRIETQAPPTEPSDAELHGAPPATPFPVVGIGASAGGLAAFETFFAAMPAGDETGGAATSSSARWPK